MTIKRTARRLAAVTLTLLAVWLWGARASATSSDGAAVKAFADVFGVSGEGPAQDYRGKTVVLHSNDTRGAAEGFARMAWLKQRFERAGAETILADAGNFSMGSIYADSKGAAALELMNLAGYDVAALGRFDLNYGYDTLKRNLRRAAFPVLCANIEENGAALCVPNYSYTTASGVTVGFFGLLGPSAESNLRVLYGHQITVDKVQTIYSRVQEQIDILRQGGSVIPGADVVIALSGVGIEYEKSIWRYNSLDVFSHAQGLDIILDGLSQVAMTCGDNGEQVQSCGGSFEYIGVVVIDDSEKAIEDHYLIPASELEDDPETLKAAERLRKRYEEEYGAVFARSEANLNGESDPGNWTEETNLGDLAAEAIVWAARRELKNAPVDGDRFVGLLNGGAIRAGVQAGDVTRNHITAALPFSNTISVVYVTGADLLEILEACTWTLPESYSTSYPQSDGVVFTLDERIAYDAGEEYGNSGLFRPASVRRVHIDSVRGKPFDPEALYAVVTNNYCAGGGDMYYLLGQAEERYDSATTVEEAVISYIRQSLGGVVTEARYGAPRGDHTILT